MKKFLNFLIPCILVLAIIFCLVWYLFIYDREFTRDMLLQGARYFESEGNLQISSWLYNQAYHRAEDNDAVAIELADQYKYSGNYTQAEYTLSSAIADGGGLDLYIALCKTYVEQDKLLDAVNMLNNVTDPIIKTQLDKRRPDTPVPSTEPGFYSQHIQLDFSSENARLYISTGSEFPSIHQETLNDSIPLSEGENTIHALAVSQEGLVSPLGVFGYTIGGIVEQVSFTDSAFEAQVRAILDVDANAVLFTNDLWDITSFQMPEEVTSYEDLHLLPYLTELTITNGLRNQLNYIAVLSSLQYVSITNTPVKSEELEAIARLPQLQQLTVKNCSLSTLSGIENALLLEKLDVSGNTVRNLKPLSGLLNLKELDLSHNAVGDLAPLSSLSALHTLDISYNTVTSLSPVCALSSLQSLNASSNRLTGIELINQLTMLSKLDISNNSVADVSLLAKCTQLTSLILSNNKLTDITALSTLNLLKELRFSNNQVAELPAFAKDCALVEIEGNYNLIAVLDPLAGLEHLNNVFMDYNPDIESVDCLADCHKLIQVNVYGTKVKDVTVLTNMSVVVNFDPTETEEE